MQETDITIYGHTDNTGSDAVNERLSNRRAESVAAYLKNCGIASSRMTTEGKSYSQPVASNETVEGRAQNRRVEIFITANETIGCRGTPNVFMNFWEPDQNNLVGLFCVRRHPSNVARAFGLYRRRLPPVGC